MYVWRSGMQDMGSTQWGWTGREQFDVPVHLYYRYIRSVSIVSRSDAYTFSPTLVVAKSLYIIHAQTGANCNLSANCILLSMEWSGIQANRNHSRSYELDTVHSFAVQSSKLTLQSPH